MTAAAPTHVGFVGCAMAGRLVKVGIVGNAPDILRVRPCPFCATSEHMTPKAMARPLREGEEVDVMAVRPPAKVKLPDDLPERILAALTAEDRPLNDVAAEVGANHKKVRRRVDALLANADPPPLILTPSSGRLPTLVRLPS